MAKEINYIKLALKKNPDIVTRLREIRKKILKYPLSYSQIIWGKPVEITPEHPCGAVCCIAGQYALLKGAKVDLPELFLFGGKKVSAMCIFKEDLYNALEGEEYLPIPRFYQTIDDTISNLFAGVPGHIGSNSNYHWPKPFCTEWDKTYDLNEIERAKAQAKIAARRITYFINKGK